MGDHEHHELFFGFFLRPGETKEVSPFLPDGFEVNQLSIPRLSPCLEPGDRSIQIVDIKVAGRSTMRQRVPFSYFYGGADIRLIVRPGEELALVMENTGSEKVAVACVLRGRPLSEGEER